MKSDEVLNPRLSALIRGLNRQHGDGHHGDGERGGDDESFVVKKLSASQP